MCLLLRICYAGTRVVDHPMMFANGEKAVKHWLEKHVRPVLENLEKNGTINENSVIFVDNYVGTKELAYRIENREDICGGIHSEKFGVWAAYMRSAYEKGKYLEQCVESLIERLNDISGEVSSLTGTCPMHIREAREEVVAITGRTISTAVDLKSIKMDRASKRQEIGQEDIYPALESCPKFPKIMERNPECPEIIATVAHVLLEGWHCTSFLLLGLRDDGKKELVNELVRYVANDGVVKIFAVDMSEYSDAGSLFRLKSNPLRSFSNGGENLNLCEAVRKHPYSILYFDKVEKAHITVYGLLLSVLRNGVMIDDEGNEVDFRATVVIFGSDCGNKHGLAHVAGHGGEIDSAVEADGGQETQESQACHLRFELLCKVDRLVFFNPFAMHQLTSPRSYQVQDLRYYAKGFTFYALSCIFSSTFETEPASQYAVQKLVEVGSTKERKAQNWYPGWCAWLPDPSPGSYRSYLARLPFA